MKRLSLLLAIVLTFCANAVSGASTSPAPKSSEVSENVERAAALYKQFKTRDALQELERALALDPNNVEALVWSARAYIDLGDTIPQTARDWEEKRREKYQTAEAFAQKAVKLGPDSTWAHFYLAVAMAKIADLSSIKKKIELAHEIRAQVDKAIALDPDNGYAYHLLGVWHRHLAEIGATRRFAALVFMQGSVPKGSMEKSVYYLKKAISYNPAVITHHLELAKTYKAIGETELAKQQLRKIETLPIQFSDDPEHKQEAKTLLRELNGDGTKE